MGVLVSNATYGPKYYSFIVKNAIFLGVVHVQSKY